MDNPTASRHRDRTIVLSQEPILSSPTSHLSESQLFLVGSQRSQSVLSSREKTPSALSSRSRPIRTEHVPSDPSSRSRAGLEQDRLATDPPFFSSEDDLFGGRLSQADVADSRFMTPLFTERPAHDSVQSIPSDANTSQAGSSVSGIDDTYLEELARGGGLIVKEKAGRGGILRRQHTGNEKRRPGNVQDHQVIGGSARRRKMQRLRTWRGKRVG